MILPYLYIGDADAACNSAELKRLGIRKILNCASEDVDSMFTEDADFSYTEFPIEDKHTGQPSQYFRDAFNVLSEVRDNKSVALVHCTTGKNIAPTIVLAHMMLSAASKEKHLSLAAALKHVKERAINAQPTDQFLEQLVELEVELFEDASVKVKRSVPGGGRGGRGGRGGKGKRGK